MTSLSSRPDIAVTDVEQIEVRPRNIGSRIKRVEDRRLLTGQGMFTDDRAVPGALHVAFLRSIHAHALISCIDIGTATDVPGVDAIYKAEHLEALVPPVRATSRMRNYYATPIYPLARGKVRYVGEPVVAVVAESRSLAEDALDRIEIAYEPLTPVVDPQLALLENATLLHEEAGTNVLAQREFGRGDIDTEMAAAAVRVGGRFRFHRKTPAAIENRACIAEYDQGRCALTLTVATSIPGRRASSWCRSSASCRAPTVSRHIGGGYAPSRRTIRLWDRIVAWVALYRLLSWSV